MKLCPLRRIPPKPASGTRQDHENWLWGEALQQLTINARQGGGSENWVSKQPTETVVSYLLFLAKNTEEYTKLFAGNPQRAAESARRFLRAPAIVRPPEHAGVRSLLTAALKRLRSAA